MNIEYVKTGSVKPYDKNPRRNDDSVEVVANSIKEFGFQQPIVVDKDMVVIAGHTRLKAAKKLKLKEVPVIVADNLTDEQAKAYRLADNKVSESSEWDFELLDDELNQILNIDMDDFGFDFTEDEEDEEDEEPEEKHNERERTGNAYNLSEYDRVNAVGDYDIPRLDPVDYAPKDLIPFNYMLTSNDYDSGVHFYVDDYQFERIWNCPDEYLDKISNFDCMLTPDFSLYMEMPIAMQIWNTYRSRLIGQMAQRRGITVIPTVSWCRDNSFDFCFDGLPERATLSVSTIGIKKEDYNFGVWKDGMDEMLLRLQPKRLLVYGGKVPYDYGDTEVIYYKNMTTERMKQKGDVV